VSFAVPDGCVSLRHVEMVPLLEKYGEQLVDYWKKQLEENGSAVLPINADLSRMVCIYVH